MGPLPRAPGSSRRSVRDMGLKHCDESGKSTVVLLIRHNGGVEAGQRATPCGVAGPRAPGWPSTCLPADWRASQ